MLKFCFRFLCYICAVGVFLICAEFKLRKVPNDISFKSQYLCAHSPDIEVLILGSSQELHGLNPSYFHSKTFNAAISGIFTEGNYYMYEKYADQLPSLKYLIFPLSYFSLDERPGIELSKNEDYKIQAAELSVFSGIDIVKNPLLHTIILTHPMTYSKKTFLSSIRDKDYSCKKVDVLGHEPLQEFFFKHTPHQQSLQIETYLKCYNGRCNSVYCPRNKEYYYSIIDDCQSKSVNLILISTPVVKEFYDKADSERFQRVWSFGDSLTSCCSNVTYVNLTLSPLFEDSDFADQNHLNPIGAKKLSLYLDSIVMSNLCQK